MFHIPPETKFLQASFYTQKPKMSRQWAHFIQVFYITFGSPERERVGDFFQNVSRAEGDTALPKLAVWLRPT